MLENPQVGDQVNVVTEARYETPSYPYHQIIREDDTLTITRVYSNRIMARSETWNATFHFFYTQLKPVNIEPRDPNLPPPNRYLDTHRPKSGEFIEPDDPRVMWIWDAIGMWADEKNYCGEYDKLANQAGVPGRPRDKKVKIMVGDRETSIVVKARTDEEAKKLAADLVSQGVRLL